MTDKDREIARLRSVLFDMLHEFEQDHDVVKDDEHEDDEAANPELCNYCRIIAEAHAVLDGVVQPVEPVVAEPPKPLDLNCKLMAPNGKRIVKILEQALVDYAVTYVYRDENGEIEFDYDMTQTSDVSWESADPVVDENDEYTFVDEENGYWKGSQLIKSTYHDNDYDSSEDDWYGDGNDGEKEAEEGEEDQEAG